MEPDITLVELTGKLALGRECQRVETLVEDLVKRRIKRVIFDMTGVDYADSAGIGMLVSKLQRLRKVGGDLRLAQLTARYQRLLGTMRVLPLFQVFDEETSAVRSFSEAPVPTH